MKTFKKFSSAEKNNPEGLPIVRIGGLYIVGLGGTDEITIMTPTGTHNAHITMRKLSDLGNGNYATAAAMPSCTGHKKGLYDTTEGQNK